MKYLRDHGQGELTHSDMCCYGNVSFIVSKHIWIRFILKCIAIQIRNTNVNLHSDHSCLDIIHFEQDYNGYRSLIGCGPSKSDLDTIPKGGQMMITSKYISCI